jgi:hypothetical protein
MLGFTVRTTGLEITSQKRVLSIADFRLRGDGRKFEGMWLSKMHRTKVEIEYSDLDLSDINVEFEGRDADEVW